MRSVLPPSPPAEAEPPTDRPAGAPESRTIRDVAVGLIGKQGVVRRDFPAH